MNKNEIIEAINAVVRPNSEKAITAESLANLLIEMVNATPEGGGGGFYYIDGTTGDDYQSTAEAKAHNVEVLARMPWDAPLYVKIDQQLFPVMMWQPGSTGEGVVLYLAYPGETTYEFLPVSVANDGSFILQ